MDSFGHRVLLKKLKSSAKQNDAADVEIVIKEKEVKNAQGCNVLVKTASLMNDAHSYQEEWILDESSRECLRCHREFSLMIRKHHCRVCGFLVCNSCRYFRFSMR